ncbi:MAG: threonine ammonia-lyase [Dehalococcoidia bacterium]|nr:threonine ammonia-lyase [Dehalococcoidia bacterium]
MTSTVTVEDIEAAHARVSSLVRRTPLWPSVTLAERLGVSVDLKCENLQRGGSFKVRGATNMLAVEGEGARGVIAASAGNHAQGVALAAREVGLPATIVMPSTAPLVKQAGTREYGATLELVDGSMVEAFARASRLAAERRLLYVPPFDHPAVVAGQGTLGLELLDQCPDAGTIVVPAGGGGLLAGIAVAVKARRPDVRVVGVQARAMAGIEASLEAGRVCLVDPAHTLADGVAVGGPSELTFGLLQEYVDDVVSVTEEEIGRAVVFLIERARLVVEGAGALAVAGLLAGRVEPRGHTLAVLSGGNIDVNRLGRLIERNLLFEGRQRKITVAAADVPGELARATSAVAAAGANVIELDHDLNTAELPMGVARLTMRIEMAGEGDAEHLVDRLLEYGLVRGTETDLATPAAAARSR